MWVSLPYAPGALRMKEAELRGEDAVDADIPGIPAELTDLDDILFKVGSMVQLEPMG